MYYSHNILQTDIVVKLLTRNEVKQKAPPIRAGPLNAGQILISAAYCIILSTTAVTNGPGHTRAERSKCCSARNFRLMVG